MALSEVIRKAFEKAVQESLEMALSTPSEGRAAGLLVVRETLRSRLVEGGIPLERVERILKGVTFEVTIAADGN